jgi:serine/threonine protein kinase
LYRGERAGRFQTYKCLKPEWRGQPLQEAMLKKEFELGYPLRHPNIRETYQYTYIEGLGNCIEMEWVDGVPLGEYLKQGRPDERRFRKLASELCDALTYLHSRQTLHRDLKPSNIMITHDGGDVKLIDFGLSDSSSSAILKTPAGTRKYMAPEVAAGGEADVRSDIWSLGAVLREMTCRHNSIIRKCTRVQASRRFRSAEEVKDALQARPLWPWLAIAAAAVAAIVALWMHKPAAEVPAPPKEPVVDTVRVLIQTPKEQDKPAQAKPRSKPSEKDKALDSIFEQASELFEDKL